MLEGEIYLITDEAVLAVGLTDSTYAECLMSGAQFWKRTGTLIETLNAGDKLKINSTSATGSIAIEGVAAGIGSAGGKGTGTGTGSQGLRGIGDGWGGLFSTTDGIGLQGSNTSTTEYSTMVEKTTALTDAIAPMLSIKHSSTGATTGFGSYNSWLLGDSTESAREIVRRTAATTVKREIWLLNAGSLTQAQEISGAGQHTLNQYGSGTFTGTAAYYLAVTSAGVVIEQAVPDESKWDKTGTTLSPKTANDVVSVTTTGDIAIYGESAGLLKGAVKGHNALGYGGYFTGGAGGVYSEVTAGAAYVGIATTGYGTTLQNSTTAAPVIYATKKNADTDSVGIMETLRRESTDAGAAGLGIAREYMISDETKDLVPVGQENIILTDPTEDATSAKYELYLRRGGTWERKVEVSHTGQLTLDLYGSGTFTGTETKLLAVTSAGAVVETAIQGTATQKITYGTELTAAANLSRANHCFKETHFNKSSAANLTLLNADWLVGDWGVIRQIDEQATIVPEDATVIITGGTKTYGAGSALRFSCYKEDSGDKYFFIDGGSE